MGPEDSEVNLMYMLTQASRRGSSVFEIFSPWSGCHDRSSFCSCSSSLASNTDEAMSVSSKIAQEMEEKKSEASWAAPAKEKVRHWWSTDLEGEVEELEVECPWTVSKGDSMDPEGELNHQSDGKEAATEEEENLGKLKDDEMEVEMEVNAGVPQAESAEIKRQRRKVIRAESEETQDYVCEMLTIGPEEADELAFVSSALSESPGAIYFCDNHCSEKAVRCWQFASMVVEEGGEARTANLCQQCCNERRGAAGRAEAELVAMESSRGEEGTSWKNLENRGTRAIHARYVGVCYSQKSRGEEDSG